LKAGTPAFRSVDVPVVPTVIPGGNHVLAAGERPRRADRHAGRVSAVLGESHLLSAGNQLDQPLGELDLERVH
jgi:hypothetical protein